ncbi:homoserine kinase [Clostridiaceae bacterium 35-E11]
MFTIKVPATTANMGPGYDVLGMALQLYNEYEIERIPKGVEFLGCDHIALEENLVYTTMNKVLERYGYKADGLRVVAKQNDIPMSRGLGSSAACIAGGIIIANSLMDDRLSVDDIIRIGTEIEGHPDNIVPAVIGGMTVSIFENEQVFYTKVQVPDALRFVVMIPDFTISTHEARKVVPDHYTKADCIYNISRVAMLLAAMNNGEVEKLRAATEDKIHQPYRVPLITDADKIFRHARCLGAKAEVISGSGSTLLAMIDKENKDFDKRMQAFLNKLENKWEAKVLEVDTKGAQIL